MQGLPANNRLIETLPNRERERLLDGCESVDFSSGEVLCSPDELVGFAWFPLSGLISRGAGVEAHPTMEVGMSGNDGMLGEILTIGVGKSPWRAVGQCPGTALRIPAADFVALVAECPALRSIAYRYLYVMIAMAARSTACTRFHGLDARLARWLLMADDRTDMDRFKLTHQSLAKLLGVQRSAVTLAAGGLQTNDIIRYSRGQIRIISRAGLDDASCGCYDDGDKDYARQFPTAHA